MSLTEGDGPFEPLPGVRPRNPKDDSKSPSSPSQATEHNPGLKHYDPSRDIILRVEWISDWSMKVMAGGGGEGHMRC